MFDSLARLPVDRLNSVVYAVLLFMERRTPRETRRFPHFPDLEHQPYPPPCDAELGAALVQEIEDFEGESLDQISDATLNTYAGMLDILASERERTRPGYNPDPARAKRILEEMRATRG